MSNDNYQYVKNQMSNVNWIKLLLERTSGVPPIIFRAQFVPILKSSFNILTCSLKCLCVNFKLLINYGTFFMSKQFMRSLPYCKIFESIKIQSTQEKTPGITRNRNLQKLWFCNSMFIQQLLHPKKSPVRKTGNPKNPLSLQRDFYLCIQELETLIRSKVICENNEHV